jgi:ABC-type multidrug transport system ATPase subunit
MNELLVNSQVNLFAHIVLDGDASLQRLAEIYTEVLFTRMVNARVGKKQKEELKQIIREKKITGSSVDINRICTKLYRSSSIQQRLLLLINLLEFALFVQKNSILLSKSDNLSGIIKQIADDLKISTETYNLCNSFVSGKLYEVTDRENVLIVKSKNPDLEGFHFIQREQIEGYLVFVYFPDISAIFFRFQGKDSLQLNSKPIQPKAVYAFQSGSVLSLNGKPILFYSKVIGQFKGLSGHEPITLRLKNIEFNYPKSKFGLHNLALTATSGELVGVMGGSGVGKSTLFNLLNGTLIPKRGSITLNGLPYSDNLDYIQKLIGFVPQDDSLFENLTVFENLYYTARLALGNLSVEQTKELVNAKLAEFGLYQIRNLKVGSSLSRNISGGQRKRLNIVTEIIREPKLLLVDEPTSGLSSSDSLRVMSLLKEQALSGRLILVNIHQPSAEIYRLFDKILVLDQGGYMVYYGNPLEAVRYFKSQAGRIDADEVECSTCRNIKSDEIFDIIDEKQVDEFGQLTEIRKVSPIDWSSRFIPFDEPEEFANPLPEVRAVKANKILQLEVFLKRLTLSKLRDLEFFVFAFIIPVLLAAVIAFFSKYSSPNESGGYTYIFYENYNIPIFFLTSIIASMFLGMIVTSDSIIKDANVNKREAFLFLSRKAYYNSKVLFYFGLTVLQTLIYTAVSIYILKVKGMFIPIWIILLLMGFFGNIAGLIVSTVFKSLSAAYLIVPFLVIPQIILSGITIPFDRMNHRLSNPEYVPFIGIVSPSMWGMETLLVYQFKNNQYERHFFEIDMAESQSRIQSQYLIPKLFQLIDNYNQSDGAKRESNKKLIESGLNQLHIDIDKTPLPNSPELRQLQIKLDDLQRKRQQQYSKAIRKKDELTAKLQGQFENAERFIEFKQMHTNRGVDDLTLARKNITAIQVVENKLVQTIDPIFKLPTSKWGRAHFLAPAKRIGNRLFDTFEFNVLVLLLFLIATYMLLMFDAIPKAFRVKRVFGD